MNFAALRSYTYAFSEVALAPGAEQAVKVEVNGLFRAERLVMVGSWDVIRGYFKLKRSRLPLIDREDVDYAATRVYRGRRGSKRWFRPGKTTVSVRATDEHKGFVREYLPSSVIYAHTDPLHLIQLRNIFVAAEGQMFGGGCPAECFGVTALGNGLRMPSTSASISLLVKNIGDVEIRVRAAVFGVQREVRSDG